MASGDRNVAVEPEGEETFQYNEKLKKLPHTVLRRVRALKKNQLELISVEAQFNQRVQELNKEFESLFNPLLEKRKAIVAGEHEPADSECNEPILSDPDANKHVEQNAPADANPSKGVPEFWLEAMSNTVTIGPLLSGHDDEILKYLVNITYNTHVNPNGFTLFFHFDENPYFTDRILKKEFEIQISPDSDDPYGYDGPVVTKCMGMPINWCPGKDITKLVATDPETGEKHPAESFFHFFDEKPKQMADINEDLENGAIEDDFNVGLFIRDELIPHAVLYYTGEKEDRYDEDGIDIDDDAADGENQAGEEVMEE